MVLMLAVVSLDPEGEDKSGMRLLRRRTTKKK